MQPPIQPQMQPRIAYNHKLEYHALLLPLIISSFFLVRFSLMACRILNLIRSASFCDIILPWLADTLSYSVLMLCFYVYYFLYFRYSSLFRYWDFSSSRESSVWACSRFFSFSCSFWVTFLCSFTLTQSWWCIFLFPTWPIKSSL